MTERLESLTKAILRFRDARDWKQFHNPKDLALALSIEAAEVNEAFLWKSSDAADKERLTEELPDVFIYTLLLAHQTGIDVQAAALKKSRLDAGKYPVKMADGSAQKYSELD